MIQSSTLDKFGILLSGVCLLHCLITPVIVTLVPILSLNTVVDDFLFHTLMLWIVVPTSAVTLFLGCRQHNKLSIVATGGLGIAILTSVGIFGHDILGESGEKVAMTFGGLVVALSHYMNYQACQSITCSDTNCSSKHHH